MPGLVTKYWKYEKFVKVSSCSRLGLQTEGMRHSVSSRSRSTFDFQKISVLVHFFIFQEVTFSVSSRHIGVTDQSNVFHICNFFPQKKMSGGGKSV